MVKALAVHSYKGGTGKTSISANLAAIYAGQGYNVCLLDYDFKAPSIQVLFKTKIRNTLNDFLEEKCEISDALHDVSKKYQMKGRLYVGFAGASTDSMREMMTKDRRWEMKALQRTLSAKNKLGDELRVDYVIFDTSPGVSYSSINALATSDFVILVSKMDEFDMEGTKEMVHGIYDSLGRKTGLLLNRIPTEQFPLGAGKKELEEAMTCTFNLPFLGVIPCYCDIQVNGGKYLFSVEQPKHPFSQALSEVIKRVDQQLKAI
ncbi:MinD/ParA family protein [Candidatus Bathyarchaeota archaeon]|nr:MinD/ParA family protein [Candidatus Bathyarchaeota archaeon]